MSEEKDPWANLADSLGAQSGQEPAARPPSPPPRPAPRPPAQRPPASQARPGWDDLDSSLGLPRSHGSERPAERRTPDTIPTEQQPSSAARSGERPPQRGRREQEFGEEPRHAHAADHGSDDVREGRSGGNAPPRSEHEQPAGDGRPRRRRGRRGGRGRGRGRRDELRDSRQDDSPAPVTHGEDEHIDDLVDDRPRGSGEPGDHPPTDDAPPRRRRRRRGRRGGRRGGDAGGDTTAGRDRTERSDTDRSSDHDDEPLPAGYGRPQAARRPESGEEDRGGGERRRRRRRRGRGDGAERRSSGDSAGESSRRRGRRGRRGSDGESTLSTSSLARRGRDDFAPVARGYDEDDEGLEFLGVEEAGREQSRRHDTRSTEDDDVVVESGLNAVRDVPSWVEAIGIVIAGNLDARNRPRSDRGDEDRRRR